LNVTTGFDADFNFTIPAGTYIGTELVGDYGMDILVKDRFGISLIEKTNVRKNFSVSVEGLEDPIFPLSTNGLVRRQYKMYPYSIYAERFEGSIATDNFTGNVTFDPSTPDTSKILVTKEDLTGLSGWGCVVGRSGTPRESQNCYVTGVDNVVERINQTIQSLDGYSTMYVDNMTDSAWILPINIGLEEGLYYDFRGPNLFERMEGKLNTSNPQFVTFVNTDELQNVGIEVHESRTRIAWIYFGGWSISGKKARGLPDWFRIDKPTTEYFNLTRLIV